MLEMNRNVAFPAAPLLTVILALVGTLSYSCIVYLIFCLTWMHAVSPEWQSLYVVFSRTICNWCSWVFEQLSTEIPGTSGFLKLNDDCDTAYNVSWLFKAVCLATLGKPSNASFSWPFLCLSISLAKPPSHSSSECCGSSTVSTINEEQVKSYHISKGSFAIWIVWNVLCFTRYGGNNVWVFQWYYYCLLHHFDCLDCWSIWLHLLSDAYKQATLAEVTSLLLIVFNS